MSRIISFSEAASIGLHTMILVAQSKNELINVNTIADRTGTSRHHVAKVAQRLVKSGMLSSSRGPSGGFVLKSKPEKVSFLDIYEAIEGNIDNPKCPSNNPVCPFDKCIMNNVVNKLTNEFRKYLESQILSSYI